MKLEMGVCTGRGGAGELPFRARGDDGTLATNVSAIYFLFSFQIHHGFRVTRTPGDRSVCSRPLKTGTKSRYNQWDRL